jgi:inner membrane protein
MAQPILERRSFGLKFLLVCVLAVLMAIPALGVAGLVFDRQNRANEVVQEIGERFGGQQNLTGPVLVAPFLGPVRPPAAVGQPAPERERGWYVMFAETGSATAALDTDVRTRGQGGLFKVRTYTADIAFEARFTAPADLGGLPAGAVVDWSRAALLVGVADVRGVKAATLATDGGTAEPLEPGAGLIDVMVDPAAAANSYDPRGSSSFIQPNRSMSWLARPLDLTAAPTGPLAVQAQVQLTGVEAMSLGVFAKNTTLNVRGDWPDVGFFGAYPQELTTEAMGAGMDAFTGRWTVPFVARGVPAAGTSEVLVQAANLSVQTRLIDPANPYQAVFRALRYALLFVGVVFLAYFIFEATSTTRAHPAQYVLVGLAQLVFYLLLLSLAERIGFDLAFVLAGGATVLLIGWYAGAVFRSVRMGVIAVACFSALYALIYLLMRAEDFALLAGSLAAFLALFAVMWATRRLDWYGLTGRTGSALSDFPPRDPPPQARGAN